ncbi:MAG TPA: branched-chain amino acid ABC transporter permease [Thermodesulfobacteriota bacterium]|nr:branched-chain amino acid ABC transporter permease [Thermodesulfobacteriota bacterium]
MDWSTNLQMVAAGLAMGSIYALVALGFVLIFNAVNVVNFAQGEFAMVPAFIAVWLLTSLKIPFPLACLITVVFMGVFGIVFQRIAYYPLRNRSFLPVVISTIGVGIFLKNAAQVLFGAEPLSMPRPTSVDAVDILGVLMDPQYIVIIICTLVLLGFQYFFFEKTLLGKRMMATAQDKEMARLLGIRVAKMIAITFAYSSMLGAAAGILVGPIFFVTKDMGAMIGLKAFCSTIVGGFGSVPGAILGGLFLGVIEVFAAYYVSTAYRDAFAFIILILVLLLRPQGFFGEKIAEKA